MRSPLTYPLLMTVLAAALVCTGSWQVEQRIRSDARADVGQTLRTILHTSREALKSRLAQHGSTAQVWADTPRLRELGFALAPLAADPAALRAAPEQQVLSEWFRSVERTTGYQRLAVIGPGNVLLAASDERTIGLAIPAQEQTGFLQRLWSGRAALSLPEPGKEARERQHWLFVGTPVLRADGSVGALLAFSVDMDRDFGQLLQQGRVGGTGETYAFDGSARMLNRSRFEEQLQALGLLAPGASSVFNISVRQPVAAPAAGAAAPSGPTERPLTRMAAAAIAGQDGMDLDGYRDYRGIEVVGAWLWDAELQVGIATEQDRAEAYESAHRIIRVLRITTALLVLLLALILLSFVLYRQNRAARMTLESYQARLEELVTERTADLQRSNAELESYSYAIAHDLRQPLRGITSFSQILREEAWDTLDTGQRDLLARIAAAGQRMSDLIDAILEVSRVTRRKLEPKDIDFSALCERIAAELSARNPERSVTLQVQQGMQVRADPRMLELALRELLANSWKFTAKRADARIDVGCIAGEYFVRDNGSGFDMRFSARLFTPFNRLHDDSALEGRGIGLAIVKRAIERNGGSIRAESELGNGATFHFTLAAA